jgi:hypothetical protein
VDSELFGRTYQLRSTWKHFLTISIHKGKRRWDSLSYWHVRSEGLSTAPRCGKADGKVREKARL